MPGTANLGADPFMAGAAGQNRPPPGGAKPGQSGFNLAQDPFMQSGAGGGAAAPAAPVGHSELLEVQIRSAEGLPPPGHGIAKSYPICVCQIKDKPGERIQTALPTNWSMTNPVWGTAPGHYTAQIHGWEEGDTLTFTIQDEDATTSRIIGMKDLTYDQYKDGFEWWLPLSVNKMKRYPEGWPYAAVQIKVHVIAGVKLTAADPFMSQTTLAPKDRDGVCNNYCLPCRMWCCRRATMCALCTWVNTKWACIMSCLCCAFSCMECGKLCGMTWDWCTGKETLRGLRRDCAKRFKLSDADDDSSEGDTACCCVPLRTAVFIISVISTFNACITFFFPRMISDDDQKFAGGYSVQSRVVVGATQLTGVFFGPMGIIGASELNVSLLNTYNYYQLVRLAGMFFMFYTDVPLLADCNLWRADINSAIKKYGWNPMMYNVAMGNGCIQAQLNLALGSVISLLVYVYLISLTRRLIWDTEQTPRYLLAMPRDMPNGAFIKHSRTQGKTQPPYGAVLGYDAPHGPAGKLEPHGLVGPAVTMDMLQGNGMGQGVGGMPGGNPQMMQQPGYQQGIQTGHDAARYMSQGQQMSMSMQQRGAPGFQF